MPTSVPTDEGRFFDGDAGAGGVGQCGPYSAADFSEYVRYGLDFDLEDGNRGVVRGILSEFQAQAIAAVRQIRVLPGAGFAQGKLGFTVVNKILDVPNNLLGVPRFDRLVLRRDDAVAVNQFSLEVLTGTAVAYPALTQNPAPGGIWEIPLWRWATPFPFVDLTGILWDETNDDRWWANLAGAAHAQLTNGSGGDLPPYSVVIQAAAAGSFTTTVTLGTMAAIGVTQERIANATAGKVCVTGPTKVRVSGAVAVGNFLVPSAAAGVAVTHAQGGFAVALSASGGGNAVIDALILPGLLRGAYASYIDAAAGDYTVGPTVAGVWTAIDTPNLQLSVVTHGRPVHITSRIYRSGGAGNVGALDVWLDGAQIGAGTGGLRNVGNLTGELGFDVLVPTLAAGTHTFELCFWCTGGSYVLSRNANMQFRFGVIEVI